MLAQSGQGGASGGKIGVLGGKEPVRVGLRVLRCAESVMAQGCSRVVGGGKRQTWAQSPHE